MTEPTEVASNQQLAISSHIAGQYLEAERYYRRALASVPDENKEASLAYQDLLALNVRLLLHMGELSNASKHAHQLLKLKEKHFGFHHTQTASALRLQAEIKSLQRNPQAATLDMRRALDIWMDSLGWHKPEPDQESFDLDKMAGPRAMLPEFDWITGELNQPALFERLSPEQVETRRFSFLLEIANAFSWLGLHKTAGRLFKSAVSLIARVPAVVVWQHHWAAIQAAQCFLATDDADAAESFLSQFIDRLAAEYDNGSDIAPFLMIALANVKKSTGNSTGALAVANKALDLLHDIHGESHLQVVQVHVDLAELLHEQNDFAASENHFNQAIAVLESWHGLSDISLVVPLYKKGLMQKSARQYQQAEKTLGRAIELLLPKDQQDIDFASKIFEELSQVYIKLNSFQQAQMAQMRGLDLLREHGRPTDLLVAHCESNMARIYFSTARYIDAEKNALSAQAAFEKQADREKYKEEIGMLYLVLGKIENELGKLQQAQQSLREAESILETVPNLNRDTRDDLNLEYAKLFVNQGHKERAISRLKEVITPESLLPANFNERTVEAMITVAKAELASGKTENVENFLLKAVKLSEDNSKKDRAYVIRALSALSQFYISQQKISLAEATVDRCAQIVEQNNYLTNQPAYAEFLTTYGALLHAKGANDVATEKLKRALAVYEPCFGHLHPKCGEAWLLISMILLERSAADQADESAHKAVTIISNAYGWNHYASLRAVAWEAYIAIHRERLEVATTLCERLFPAIQTIRITPDVVLVRALSAILKVDMLNHRTKSVTAISDYLEKHARMFLLTYGGDAVDLLLELMADLYKFENRRLAIALGESVLEYLSGSSCLISDRKAKLKSMMLRCHDYSHIEEGKILLSKVRAAMEGA